MNRSLQEEMQELERITSTAPLTAEEQQTEAAQLRANWIRWTQVLAAADEAYDEEAFVQRIQPPANPSRSTRLFVWATLAASLLIASLTLATRMGLHSLHDPATPSEPRISRTDNRTDQPTPMLASESTRPDADLVWDDKLDERLDNLQSAVASLQGSALRRDGHLSVLQSRLSEVLDDIATDSL